MSALKVNWSRQLWHAICVAVASLTCVAAVAQTVPPMEPIRVSENSYYVQGLAALGSPKNQNFISNAGFVIAKEGVVVVDALGSPALAARLVQAIAKITPPLAVPSSLVRLMPLTPTHWRK